MEEYLKQLGLNENEAKIYLAGLALGPTTVQFLAVESKIKRSTAYVAINYLIEVGLFLETYSNKKKLFQAERPEKLEKLTKRMRRKAMDAELMLQSLIPTLKQIPRSGGVEPKIFFYQGINGLKNVLLDVSGSRTSWYVFGSTTEILKRLANFDLREILEEGEKLRQQSDRPKIFFITDSGILALKEFQEYQPERREIKILPHTIKSGTAFIVYQDKVVILDLVSQPTATVIQSAGFVEIMKTVYKLIWNSLPEK
jgi:sugar-specific transcriptional regulator TrmB